MADKNLLMVIYKWWVLVLLISDINYFVVKRIYLNKLMRIYEIENKREEKFN